MRNKLALSIALVASLQASLVSALSLGDLTVESKVNEPLNAVIELNGASHLSASQILVQLAGPEDFRRANVERPFFLTSITFNVEQNSNGASILRLTSSEKVTEPYINFILETRWPNGRVMREYLALLDLPIHSSAQGRGVEVAPQTNSYATNSSAQSPSRAANTYVRPSTTGANGVSAPSGSASGTESYTVKSNDTAWEIAEKFTPSGARVEQTLYALYDQNTGAFANGDVNLLNNGAVLRVPDADEVAAVSPAQAKNWQREQHSKWKAKTSTAKTSQALDGGQKTRKAQTSTEEGNGHLTLTSQRGVEEHLSKAEKTLQEATKTEGSASSDAELVAALEKLDSTQLEKNALDERYASLQQRFSQLEKLVSLKNAQLAELTASVEKSDQILTELESNNNAAEASLLADDQAVGEVSEEAVAGDLTASEVGATDSGANADSQNGAELAGTLAGNEGAAASEITAAEKTTLSANDSSLAVDEAGENAGVIADATPAIVKASGTLDTIAEKLSGLTAILPAALKQNLVAVGGVVSGLLLAIAGFFVVRARRANSAEASDLALETPIWSDTDFENEEDQVADAESDEEVGFGLPQASIEGDEGLELVEEGVSEVGGLLAEVDIYLSYGRHDQAVESLQQLIANNESNTELHLKLIEVYRAQGDQAQAQQTAETLLKFDPAAQPQVNDLLNDLDVAISADDTQSLDSDTLEFALDSDASVDSEENGLDLSLDINEDSTSSSTDDFTSLDDEDFSAAFESSDGTSDGLDLSDDSSLGLEGLDNAGSELAGNDFDNEFDIELGDIELNDIELSDSDSLGELDTLQVDSLDSTLELDSIDVMQSLETETLSEDLEVTLDLESDNLETNNLDLDETGLDLAAATDALDIDDDVTALDVSASDSLDLALEESQTLDDESQSALAVDSSAEDAGSLDSEIAAAYGDLDIDLSAAEPEAKDIPQTSFGNPSVEEVLGTDDIPTLEMGETYVSDDELSESLGLETEGQSNAEVAETADLDVSALTDDDLEAEYQSAAAMLEQSGDATTEEQTLTVDVETDNVPAEAVASAEDAEANEDDFGDETATKLDLARAYLEMGDIDGAKDVLDEVISEGDKRQQQEATALLQKIA